MRSALAFICHLAVALLATPTVTFFSTTLAYWVIRYVGSAATSPQQFYSDHLLLLASVSGLLLGYWVCETFTSRSAIWVWIPAVLALGVRIAVWRSTGSVLFHASVIEHFVTADCQIQSWREAGFTTFCSDKLLLMPVIVGSLGYSVGAAVQRIVVLRRRSNALPS